ncbi:hypothetical protein BKA70DRAFT_1087530 [Coprinopsis sp. MPI-PUGE-AT-0042]|nr:hypothetical protein BKA70DRAFT_1087530 [Coprinopsis sp. MPI-PUGE-AT-0042]
MVWGDAATPSDVLSIVLFIRLQTILNTFGLHARLFLFVLRLLSACVSGSVVLAVLHGGNFVPGDLDIYVPYNRWFFMKLFLQAHRDIYLVEDLVTIGKPRRQGRYPIPGVTMIWYFHNRKTDTAINVMVTKTRSPFPAIIAFHSTLVMNVITYFGIVSLYGQPTAQKMGWYNGSRRLNQRDRDWMRKYRQRGYSIYNNSLEAQAELGRHKCGTSTHCTQTIRSLFDDGVHLYRFKEYLHKDKTELLKRLEPWFIWRLQNSQCEQHVEIGRDSVAFVATPQDYIRLG